MRESMSGYVMRRHQMEVSQGKLLQIYVSFYRNKDVEDIVYSLRRHVSDVRRLIVKKHIIICTTGDKDRFVEWRELNKQIKVSWSD